MATILIVDAPGHRRGFLTWLLAHRGHRVVEAGSGDEALALIAAERPDLLVMDLLVPDPGGYRLLQRVRSDAESVPPVLFHVPPYAEAEARRFAADCAAHLATHDASPESFLAAMAAALRNERPLHAPCDGRGEDLCPYLYPIIKAQHVHLSELEAAHARVEQQAAEWAVQLDAARDALAEEVSKRLWEERELTRSNQQLRAQAVRDALTGLYNRRYLEESLEREESRAKRSGRPLGIMVMDIDHFKRCNDGYGHAAGDTVLREVSRLMESLARSEDILCRYGGEEFILVMANTSLAALRQRAEDLRTGVERLSIEHEGRALGPVTLSIGIAMFPQDGASAAEVLHAADAALYQAKGAGRNCVVVAGRAMA